MSRVRIGISGWTYAPWRGGVFYPQGLVQKRELDYASRQFDSIEINGTFYSLQSPKNFQVWYDSTPEGFIFSVKGTRFITHMRRLRDVGTPLANFFASGVLRLKEKLGPILWQLPPSLKYDRELLVDFLQVLPRNTEEAASLGKRHDHRVKGRGWTKTDRKRRIRHALEVRHESFVNEEFVETLRKFKVALVVADTAGKWPFMEDVTSDFVYVRLHGAEEIYVSGYDSRTLHQWERKIRSWKAGKSPGGSRRAGRARAPRKSGQDVYVYFDNDVKAYAPRDARELSSRLRLPATR